MGTRTATKERIIHQLGTLGPSQWKEVLDFIDYLHHRELRRCVQPEKAEMTARDLLESGLVGVWADREDIDDSVAFARRLRRQAETRQDRGDDSD
jgi:hypothetical protein